MSDDEWCCQCLQYVSFARGQDDTTMYLSQRDLLTSTKEWLRVFQERFDLLAYNVHKFLAQLRFLIFRTRHQNLVEVAARLAKPSVNEEVDSCPGQGSIWGPCCGEDVRRVRIGQERCNDARFCDDLTVEINRRNKTALLER